MKTYIYNPSTEHGEYGHLERKASIKSIELIRAQYPEEAEGCKALCEADKEAIRKSIIPVSKEWAKFFNVGGFSNTATNSLAEFMEDKDFIIKDGFAVQVEDLKLVGKEAELLSECIIKNSSNERTVKKKICRMHTSQILEEFFSNQPTKDEIIEQLQKMVDDVCQQNDSLQQNLSESLSAVETIKETCDNYETDLQELNQKLEMSKEVFKRIIASDASTNTRSCEDDYTWIISLATKTLKDIK